MPVQLVHIVLLLSNHWEEKLNMVVNVLEKWRFGHLKLMVRLILLQEILTVKSDDVQEGQRYMNHWLKVIIPLQAGTPQSFNVLMKEMQSLCLDIRVLGEDAL